MNSSPRTVWITGASRGIGRALALGFAQAGYDVALSARDEATLGAVAEQIRGLGRAALVVPADVADPDAVATASGAIAAEWGGLDACVASAGISPTMTRSLEVPVKEWRRLMSINLDGAFWTMQAAARLMKDRGGSIVAMSSVHARSAGKRLAAYSASKGGIEALVRTLAVEWAQLGIRVNAIAPGYVETDLTEGLRGSERLFGELTARTPMGRFAKPEELVSSTLFLASADSSYLTGSVLSVDGGWTAA